MQLSVDKLQKFLKLEAERGYDNRAVVGGLEKVLPIWESEARADLLSEDVIAQIRELLQHYSEDVDSRKEKIASIWSILGKIIGNTGTKIPEPKPPRPALPPKRADVIPQKVAPRSSSPGPRSVPAASQPGSINLYAPLTVIQGIGPKYGETLKTLGLNTLNDLLYYFPRRYDDYSELKPINRIFYGDTVTVIGVIQNIITRPIKGGTSHIVEAMLSDGTGGLRLSWFNQLWITTRLKPDMQIVVSGKVDQYLGRLVISNPEWEQLEQEQLHTNRIVPVYPLTAGITSKWLRRIMHQTVSFWSPRVADYMPKSIVTEYNLMDLSNALREVHFPSGQDSLRTARKRIAFDEIFLMQLGVLRQKSAWKSATAQVFKVSSDQLSAWEASLPYALTKAQKKVIQEIQTDLQSGQPMNRLLQGDVGSGKTVVAALGMAMVISNGAQAAIMAPTSILAEQHYKSLTRLLTNSGTVSILQPEEICLLVGDTSAAERERIKTGLLTGSIKLIIGTHALLEDPVQFNNLQMIVVDEQHRFGVEQRATLRGKGSNPHLLVMTATPIPRSLALTVYGDLDLSLMDEYPAGRQDIETQVLYPRERETAYTRISNQVEAGRQAFIIYPLVEQGDNDEAKAAVEEHARLQKEIFTRFKIGLLHGRMKPDEKEKTMTKFRDHELDILVSTSVVEVGVDVPNATMMLVEGANRFGLAQLHQFRGRVGRGEFKSYCILIPEKEDDTENERLKAMAETNDGFVLAEKDLEQRGPGDFLGSRQAGFTDLRMASLSDVRLIEKAREGAEKLFSVDPDLGLPEHQPLVQTLDHFWRPGKGDIS